MSPDSREASFHLLATTPYGESVDHGIGTRLYIEYLSGLGIGLVGVVVGMVAISDYPTLKEAALPAALGIVGSAMGVTFAGWALDGRGRAGFALLGSLIGFGAPLLVGTGFLLASGCDTQAIWDCGAVGPMVVGMLILTPLVATTAYELSAPKPWLSEDYASRSPRPAPRFVPVLTLARQGVGGTLGIAGRL
ncbi:hypothetical protein [Hyalangium sp.]|uniref:hypothetical protein n=1 Tax=Hyalangium sp. TaxID=2028555 RepID=UPI002D5671A3|nr:hypothetical protein [Hyalangium sp.]HYH96678.1 hypothetical protein [Hyalangium sp.]